MPIPIHENAGILNPAIIGNKKAFRGMNKNVVVSGLVARVRAIVPQNTAHEPHPPQRTISQWKKTSRK